MRTGALKTQLMQICSTMKYLRKKREVRCLGQLQSIIPEAGILLKDTSAGQIASSYDLLSKVNLPICLLTYSFQKVCDFPTCTSHRFATKNCLQIRFSAERERAAM